MFGMAFHFLAVFNRAYIKENPVAINSDVHTLISVNEFYKDGHYKLHLWAIGVRNLRSSWAFTTQCGGEMIKEE